MQPYLESLPNYIDGVPPWTPTNRGHGITSRSLKHYLEISPRDFKELRTNTYQTYSINKVIFIMHRTLMPTFITNSSFTFHVEFHSIHPFPNHECRSVFHTDTMPYSLTNLHSCLISNPYQNHHFNSMNHPIRTSCSRHVKTHESQFIIHLIYTKSLNSYLKSNINTSIESSFRKKETSEPATFSPSISLRQKGLA